MTDVEYTGKCYCGAVEVIVKGPPVGSGYCHCLSCRKWHAAPINAFSLWNETDVSITGDCIKSAVDLGSLRVSCAKCGGNVANKRPERKMIVVYPMTLVGSGVPFEPFGHIFYSERVMDVNDGLPKFEDRPETFGGSGKVIKETEITGWI